MSQNSAYIPSFIFCQDASRSQANGAISLINTFDQLDVLIGPSDQAQPSVAIQCYLFAKLADPDPKKKYELGLEVVSPSQKKLFDLTGPFENTQPLKPDNLVIDILQPLTFNTNEEGEHLIRIKSEGQIIGQKTLVVSYQRKRV